MRVMLSDGRGGAVHEAGVGCHERGFCEGVP